MTLASDAAQRRSQSVFLPAPLLGLNTVDAPGIMTPEYALQLTNFLPLQNGLETRGGSLPWAVGLPGDVESVLPWTGGTGHLFAASGGAIYRLPETPDMQVEPIIQLDGFTSNWFQHVNFTNNGGTWLWACNGEDAPAMYNGTEWQLAAITGISGDKQPVHVAVYQNRLFFCVPGSLDMYYLETDAIQGAASKLPLGAYFDRGGEILLLGNVTVDGGYGPDDYLIAVTSEGEIASFKGRNPDSASSWAMVGRFQIARPMGRRSAVKWAGDLVIMTEHGVAGISGMLSNELAGLVQAATEKIQPTWAQLARNGYGRNGWDICVYHRRGLMFLNIPTPYTGSTQYVFNPTTVAWADVAGWEEALCFVEYQGQLLAGMKGRVQLLDVFTNDVKPDGIDSFVGYPVVSRLNQAFVQPAGGGVKKQYTLMRPYVSASVQPQVNMGLNTDNIIKTFSFPRILSPVDEQEGMKWNEYEWNTSVWATFDNSWNLRTRWATSNGVGYSVSVGLEVTANITSATYTGCDLQYIVSNAL